MQSAHHRRNICSPEGRSRSGEISWRSFRTACNEQDRADALTTDNVIGVSTFILDTNHHGILDILPRLYDWKAVPWRKLERAVFKLQKRIYRATQQGNKRLVRRLQGLMTLSWSAFRIAVRQVTQQNQGKKTAGVDGVTALKPSERQPLVRQLRVEKRQKVQPTCRVWAST